jgi:ketosteroid isomerase-like protein
MPSSAHVRRAAHEPAELDPIIERAVNGADVDAFVSAHDEAAAVVVPPAGAIARGHTELRVAMAARLTLHPRIEMHAVRVLERGGVALAHGSWRLTVIDDGSRIELSGLGAMVSRRGADGDGGSCWTTA